MWLQYRKRLQCGAGCWQICMETWNDFGGFLGQIIIFWIIGSFLKKLNNKMGFSIYCSRKYSEHTQCVLKLCIMWHESTIKWRKHLSKQLRYSSSRRSFWGVLKVSLAPELTIKIMWSSTYWPKVHVYSGHIHAFVWIIGNFLLNNGVDKWRLIIWIMGKFNGIFGPGLLGTQMWHHCTNWIEVGGLWSSAIM